MKKIFFILSLILVASISMAANRTAVIKTGTTEIYGGLSLGASDTIKTSATVTVTITNIQQYLQNQTVTVGLTTVSGSPNVTITFAGKVTANGEWTTIGTPITWTTSANNGSIISTAPLNYNFLKVTFAASGATQLSKITTFEVKTAKVFDIGSASAYVLGVSTGTMAITSSDWAIGTTGICTGLGAITSDGILTVTGASSAISGLAIANGISGKVTTATAGSDTTAAGAKLTEASQFVTVTSGSSAYKLMLPAISANLIGAKIEGYVGANGFKLRAASADITAGTIYLNNQAGAKQATIGANVKFTVTCVSATQWILTATDYAGAAVATITPAAF